mmetsp:Transcript_76619/g.212066  ORF Transcript_76619/g.212066 Transcript_76619/m.212066 type:complete len:651 (-) Transcript_76619:216-2168(-)
MCGSDDPGRVPQVHREGRGAGAPLPAGPRAGAERAGHGDDPEGPPGPLRRPPRGGDPGRGPRRRSDAVGEVHHHTVPAGQGRGPRRRGLRRHPRAARLAARRARPHGAEAHGAGGGGQGPGEGEGQGLRRPREGGAEGVGGARGEAAAPEGAVRARALPADGAAGGEAEAPGAAEQDAARGDPRGRGHGLRPEVRGHPGAAEAHPLLGGREGAGPLCARGGRHGRERGTGGGEMDGHPRAEALTDGARAAVGAGSGAEGQGPWAGGGRRRGGEGGADQRGAAEEQDEAHGLLPLPGTDGRGEDGDGQGLGPGALRQRVEDAALRHVRVHGEALRVAAHRRSAGLCGPRGGRPADGGPPPHALRRGALRRAREGAPGRAERALADLGRRAHHGLPGAPGGLQQRRLRHDLEHGAGAAPGGGAARLGAGGGQGAVPGHDPALPAPGAAEPRRRHRRLQPPLRAGAARRRPAPARGRAGAAAGAGARAAHLRRGAGPRPRGGLRPGARRQAAAALARAARGRRVVAEDRRGGAVARADGLRGLRRRGPPGHGQRRPAGGGRGGRDFTAAAGRLLVEAPGVPAVAAVRRQLAEAAAHVARRPRVSASGLPSWPMHCMRGRASALALDLEIAALSRRDHPLWRPDRSGRCARPPP